MMWKVLVEMKKKEALKKIDQQESLNKYLNLKIPDLKEKEKEIKLPRQSIKWKVQFQGKKPRFDRDDECDKTSCNWTGKKSKRGHRQRWTCVKTKETEIGGGDQ